MAEGDIRTDDDVWLENFKEMYLPEESERIGEGQAPKPNALIHISIGTDIDPCDDRGVRRNRRLN